ncbi:MAG: PAS domain S-box protein, partial [Candidatus Hydrogenedentes bacterium]|nr:PAS domain S-box protein [Candidatus Hydrogenedentota bacterium]
MRDQRKTKAQLIDELRELRARLDSIEATRADAQSGIDALYRRVVELSPDPFAVLQDGIVKFASPSFETVFGYTQEDIARGMSITSFVSDKDREILVQRVNDRLAGKDISKHFQIDVIAKDGHIVHCETAGVVMEFEGRPANLVLTLDVTDRVKMEMELRAARSDLETKVAQRTAELKAANRQLWEEIAERGRIMETLRESEEHIRAILESTADGILVVDKENKITHLNARFAELWKIPSELLETRDDRKLLEYAAGQLEHPEIFLDAVRYLYGTKDTSFDTIRFKDGRVIERYTTPLLKDNSVEGRVWSFRDVTDRYRAHDEAYKFKTISDNANYGVAMVALDGTLLYLNDTFANMYGYERNELIGTSLRDLHTGDQLLQVERLTRLAINRGGFKAEELWRTKKDGTEHPALLSGTMIRDDQGRPLFFSITAIDTTELHRSQKERAAFESELQKSQRMESLGRMAAAVAHDFNNILTLIMGYVDIAATALPQDAETRDYIERIFSAGHQARDIIDQILAFAREETRDETPVLVHLVVKEVLSLIEPAIPPTVTVRRHIDAAAGSVRIGAMQIHRAVANLCTNALYAMKQDGGVLELRVERVDVDPETARSVSNLHAGPYVRVTVSDTGTGI